MSFFKFSFSIFRVDPKSLLIAAILLGGIPGAHAEDGGRAAVTKICSDVEKREPIRCLTTSTALVGGRRLYADSRVTHFNSSDHLYHVWSFDHQPIARIGFQPSETGWRAVTSVAIAGRNGNWQLDIETADHKVIESLKFVIARGKRGTRARLLSTSWQAGDETAENNKPAVLTKETPSAPVESSTAVSAPSPSVESGASDSQGESQRSGAWSFGVGANIHFDRLDTTQKANSQSATFLSNLLGGPSLFGEYASSSRHWVSQAFVDASTNSYQAPTGKTLSGIPQSLLSAEFREEWRQLAPRLRLQGGLGVREDFFDVATSMTNLQFQSAWLPTASLGAAYDLVETSKVEWDVQARAIREFGASSGAETFNGAWGVEGETDLRLSLGLPREDYIMASLDYETYWQDTNLITRTRSGVAAKLLYVWRFAR